MTEIEEISLDCPNCGLSQKMIYFRSLYLDSPKSNPDGFQEVIKENEKEKKRLFSGDINCFKCRKCGHTEFLPFPFSLIDEEIKYKVWYLPFEGIDAIIQSGQITVEGFLNMKQTEEFISRYKDLTDKKLSDFDYMKYTHFVFSMPELINYAAFREKLAQNYSGTANIDDNVIAQRGEDFFNRARDAENNFRYEEARIFYDKAVEANPGNPDIWNYRGVFLADSEAMFEEAVASYDEALKRKNEYPEAWNNRGLALFQLGRDQEALTSYNKALTFNPKYPEAWNNRASVLYRLGRGKEAAESQEKAKNILKRS